MYIRTQRALAVGVSEKTKVIRKIKTLFNRKEEGIPLRLIEVGVSCPLLNGKII